MILMNLLISSFQSLCNIVHFVDQRRQRLREERNVLRLTRERKAGIWQALAYRVGVSKETLPGNLPPPHPASYRLWSPSALAQDHNSISHPEWRSEQRTPRFLSLGTSTSSTSCSWCGEDKARGPRLLGLPSVPDRKQARSGKKVLWDYTHIYFIFFLLRQHQCTLFKSLFWK